ncbi:MAG: hypothetical protein M3162_07950 [Thermoproteota archaeon]|nr:hypothetical protein [Thermoproteota archaeon]
MNKIATMSMFLIAVLATGILHTTIIQTANAQLDPIDSLTKMTNTSISKMPGSEGKTSEGTSAAAASPTSTKLKEGLANIFEIYQLMIGKNQPEVLLKLNNIERILLETLR